MITEQIRHLLRNAPFIFVASTDSSGQPHMAVGEQVAVTHDSQLVFENLFCPVTLQNISGNSHVTVVVFDPVTGVGYQMLGSVARNSDASVHDAADVPDDQAVLTRFSVKVHRLLEFSNGIHSDIPLGS